MLILYTASTDKQSPPPDTGKFVRLIIIAIIAIAILTVAGNQAVILSMNFTEFGVEFSKPLYYSTISAIILSAIAVTSSVLKAFSNFSEDALVPLLESV